MTAGVLTLTGILAATDSFERLRLCLVSELAGRPDRTWARLKDELPKKGVLPYALPQNGRPDDAGICGECWVTLPARGRGAAARRRRVLALAAELRGKPVEIRARPKRFAIPGGAAGTQLVLCTLVPLRAAPRHI